MALWVDALRVFTAVNVVLLLGLSYVWVRNFLTFRSKHTLGLALFAVLLLVENAMTGYLFTFHQPLAPWIEGIAVIAQQAIAGVKLFELLALLVLTYTTWD